MNAQDLRQFSRVVERLGVGSRLLRAWDLQGGVSARTVAVEFERPGGERERAVIRLHGEVDRAGNPEIAADEFRLLEIVRAAGIPAPEPLLLDRSCELFEIPYLVISFIEGATDQPLVGITLIAAAMAEQLAAIHRIGIAEMDLSFLPRQEECVTRLLHARPEQLDERLSEGRIRDALEAVWPLPHLNPRSLLHGDYWPGNILWRDDEIATVIDWEDAATGDPLADLANGRLELLWAFGEQAMTAFTAHYRSQMPSLDYANLPYWDLYAALQPAGNLSGWGLDIVAERRMQERHRKFVEWALERGNR